MTRPSPRDVTSDANSARNVERGSITCYSSESITKKTRRRDDIRCLVYSCVLFSANFAALNAPLALPVNRGLPRCQPNFLRPMKERKHFAHKVSLRDAHPHLEIRTVSLFYAAF